MRDVDRRRVERTAEWTADRILAAIRSGDLAEERVQGAAEAGHPGAQLVVGPPEVPGGYAWVDAMTSSERRLVATRAVGRASTPRGHEALAELSVCPRWHSLERHLVSLALIEAVAAGGEAEAEAQREEAIGLLLRVR